jgi:RNA polymerase sigma-70 factor (ECF subfamily)
MESTSARFDPDGLYQEAVGTYGPALVRLARGYEADPDRRRDLLQEIHLQLWRSFSQFDARCSLRTWIYRVAHNCARSHVARESRIYSKLVDLGQLADAASYQGDTETAIDRENSLDKLLLLIQKLKPADRQVILLYLEGLDAASIGEVTGISPAHVAVKIGRIKSILARWFRAPV